MRHLVIGACATAVLCAAGAVAGAHPAAQDTIELLSGRIRLAPTSQALFIERGIAYSDDGDFARALADFRTAGTLGDPVQVALDLGVLHYRRGDFAQAREALTRYLARFPRHAIALDYRARAAREAGDARAALTDLEALFALGSPVNPGQYLAAAELLVSLPDGGVDVALAALDRGMARLGVIPQLQERAVALERERGAFDAALRRHETLAGPLSRSPAWRVERAELLLRLGRQAEAERELADAAAALAGLRATPARAALGVRIAELGRGVEERAGP